MAVSSTTEIPCNCIMFRQASNGSCVSAASSLGVKFWVSLQDKLLSFTEHFDQNKMEAFDIYNHSRRFEHRIIYDQVNTPAICLCELFLRSVLEDKFEFVKYLVTRFISRKDCCYQRCYGILDTTLHESFWMAGPKIRHFMMYENEDIRKRLLTDGRLAFQVLQMHKTTSPGTISDEVIVSMLTDLQFDELSHIFREIDVIKSIIKAYHAPVVGFFPPYWENIALTLNDGTVQDALTKYLGPHVWKRYETRTKCSYYRQNIQKFARRHTLSDLDCSDIVEELEFFKEYNVLDRDTFLSLLKQSENKLGLDQTFKNQNGQ